MISNIPPGLFLWLWEENHFTRIYCIWIIAK